MTVKENPFPSDGDAAKIPKFTDFLICLREDRKMPISGILLPILERANIGEISGNHDAVVVGEIGRGKTHLLKFLEKKLLGKKAEVVSDSLDIPTYNNIIPIYVKFDASMTVAPDKFIYFFVNYLFGFASEEFGILNSPAFRERSPELKLAMEKSFTKRTGQDIRKPQTISAQSAIDLVCEICEEALRAVQKKSILFLFDELEGIILIAQKQKTESLFLVMDFLRQFHDAINQEEASQANVYAFYAMTAPAARAAFEAQQESGAWLSRLRSQIVYLPQFSEDELKALASVALEHDNLTDFHPFNQDALTYIYRSVMGQPRYAIQALYNAYDLYIREKPSQIGPREVFRSTRWLDPDQVIDNTKVAKLKAELGPRYAYLVQIFSDLIAMSTIPMTTIVEKSRKSIGSDVSRERVVTDIGKFGDYVEISDKGEDVKVLNSFYNRILKELETGVKVEVPVDPGIYIQGSAETLSIKVKTGQIQDNERLNRLTESLDKVLKQLFAEEGVTFESMSGDWRLYKTKKSPGARLPINLLSKPLLSSAVNQAEIVSVLEKTEANVILFLYDLDNKIEDEKFLKKLKDMSLPESYPWIKELFSDSFKGTPDKWLSKHLLENTSKKINLFQICVAEPVSYGKKGWTGKASSGQVLIDQKGFWYSIPEIGRDVSAEYGQLLEGTQRYIIQDFFGHLRKDIIDKSSVQSKNISTLFPIDAKSRTALMTTVRALMNNPKCLEAISKRLTIVSDDLPPGANSVNMDRLSDIGLFSKMGDTSWKANSLNDAQQYNPWIRFIVFNSTSGKPKTQILKVAKDTNLGQFEESVLTCLKNHFELLEILGLMKKDQVILVDNKVQLVQEIQSTRQRISGLKQKEFAGAEHILSAYSTEIDEVERESTNIDKEARSKIEADGMYKTCLDRLSEIGGGIQKAIDDERREADSKQKQFDEIVKRAEEEQKKAIAVCDLLDFNNSDSPIVKALNRKTEVKPYVLEIQLPIVRPHAFNTILQERIALDTLLKDGFLAKFLSEYASFESHMGDAVNQARGVETIVKEGVEEYTTETRRNYARLLDIERDFSPGPRAQISEMTADAQRSLSNKQYAESLMLAGEARLLLVGYIEAILKKVGLAVSERKSRLVRDMKQQISYLGNSMALLEKKTPKSSKSAYKELEKTAENLRKRIESFEKIVQPDLNEKPIKEIVDDILKLVSEIVSKEKAIKTDLSSLNESILRTNKSIFKESFSKALRFISEFGEINSLNYTEFMDYIGDKDQGKEAIIELLEIGLASLNMPVKE